MQKVPYVLEVRLLYDILPISFDTPPPSCLEYPMRSPCHLFPSHSSLAPPPSSFSMLLSPLVTRRHTQIPLPEQTVASIASRGDIGQVGWGSWLGDAVLNREIVSAAGVSVRMECE